MIKLLNYVMDHGCVRHSKTTEYSPSDFRYLEAIVAEYPAVISVDLETTSLLPDGKQRAWQAGMAYCIFNDNELAITKMQATTYIPELHWEASTFSWMLAQPVLSNYYAQARSLAATDPWQPVRSMLTAIKNLVDMLPTKPLLVINHPEFDMPIFDAYAPGALRDMVGHRNVVDLQSVMLGRMGSTDRVRDYLKQFGAAQHVAADDAEFNILALLGMKF